MTQPVETQQQPEQQETPPGEQQEDEPKTYDEDYVKALRDEAATNRVKAGRATELETALREAVVSKVAAGILQDPASLEWSDEFNDEHGMPNPDAIREAAEALAAAKPTLARVGGDVLQGHRGDDSDSGEVDLAGWIKSQV
jgi:hypothetical protein